MKDEILLLAGLAKKLMDYGDSKNDLFEAIENDISGSEEEKTEMRSNLNQAFNYLEAKQEERNEATIQRLLR